MNPAHRVRIIGGRWKRTPLSVADVPGLRPTPDRVRETVFNWLGGDLTGLRCLDLFGGSGALGLESASRGAAAVTVVERDRRAAAGIRAAIGRLGAHEVVLVEGDALATLGGCARRGERFDLVFLDPPFREGWLERVMPRLAPVLAPGARLYVEHETTLDADALAALAGGGAPLALAAQRAGKAGQVHYHLFSVVTAPSEHPA